MGFFCLSLIYCLDKDQSLAIGVKIGCKKWDQVLGLYLLLLNPVLNLFGGRLMCSKQADGAGKLWVKYVSIFVSDHQVKIQVPCIQTGLTI